MKSDLKWHDLDTGRTLPFLQDSLEDANELSKAILQYIDFNKGHFYTLLNKEIPFEQLYQFKSGGVGGSIRGHISSIVLQKIEKEENLICLFDDIGATYQEPYEDSLFLKVGCHFNEEVYYLVTNQNRSKSLLDTCFYASGGGWHSLCVVSSGIKSVRKDRAITKADIQNIARNTVFILIGSYDDESFVFWEKTNKT